MVALELGNAELMTFHLLLDSQQVDYWRRAILYGEGGEYDQAIVISHSSIKIMMENVLDIVCKAA